MPHQHPDDGRLLALLLISAAWSDGQLHPREARMIRVGLGSETYQAALQEYSQADPQGRAALLGEVRQALQSPQSREKALGLVKQLFLADGTYSPDETEWIQRVWRDL